MPSAPREDNRVPSLVGKSDADNSPVVIEADPVTKRLKVSAIITSGGGGGGSDVQYTDGDAAATHPIGTIPVFNNAGTITAVSAANPLPVSATISTAGLATSTKQSDGSQKTQVVDGSGNVIGATSNALDVNIKSGNSTSIAVTQSTASNLKTQAQIFDPGTGNGASVSAFGAVKVDGSAVTQPVSGTVTANQGTAAALTAGWPVIGGELADTTGTFTNATQTTSVTSSSFDGYSTVIVSISGTYGTATGVFEISDDGGTTWYSVNAARTDGSAVETGYTSLTNTNRMWTLSVSGADEFRVRSTAVASGTVNVRLSIESMPTPEAATVTTYQPTAANLNATVVGTGTFSVQTSAQVPGTGATNLGKAEDAAHASGDTGVFALGVRNDGAATTFSNANGDYTPIGVDAQGRVYVVQKSTTSTGSNVSTSTTSTTLLAVNSARVGGSIYNDSTQILYIKFGATASSTDFKAPLAPALYYEIPAGYNGRIDGILAAGTGTARVAEET